MLDSQEEIEAFAETMVTVEWYQLEDSIVIAFYCFYVYYLLTTMHDEVSIILPQKWNRGKALYTLIRYGMLFRLALQLSRDYRTYFVIAPAGCKAMFIIHTVTGLPIRIAISFSLGLCLGALLQVQSIFLVMILVVSCGLPLVDSVTDVVAAARYPAEPPSALLTELGYPCYNPSFDLISEQTYAYVNINIRAYLDLSATTLLAILGTAAIVFRYKGQGGRLLQVLRRDGGLYFISLIAIKTGVAILSTPAVISSNAISYIPLWLMIGVGASGEIIVPILAQRLLINMRKVDYMGSEPVASKLLFAPPPPGSEDDLEHPPGSFEMAP